MTQFTKPAITPEEQLQLLIDRGLTIQDQNRALSFIKAVSFFRLSPYMRPFQQANGNHTFHANAGFKQLSELYDFDRRLRLLIMDAIERAEVAVRAHLSNYMGVKYGAHWYLDTNKFRHDYRHQELLESIEGKQDKAARDYLRECGRIDQLRKPQAEKATLKLRRMQESYARHYQMTYTAPALLPNWAMVEELTLGQLSHMYKGLKRDTDKKAIARELGLAAPLLESWLHTLTAVRNICAHHSRLWNRELGIKPALPKNAQFNWPAYLRNKGQESIHTRISVVLPILQHFMNECAPHASWQERLFVLFDQFPKIALQSMGLPNNWREDPFWLNSSK